MIPTLRNRPGPPQWLAGGLAIIVAMGAPMAGCDRKPDAVIKDAGRPPPVIACDQDNGGLTLPAGFCALVVADHFANLRDLAVNANGDLYVSLLNRRMNYGGLVALRDRDGDGRADDIQRFGDRGGVGIAVHAGHLYLGQDTAIVRYRLRDELVPRGEPEVVVRSLPATVAHASKTFAFDTAGGLYVSVGAPSNACQKQNRGPGSAGLDPCPELATSGGVWHFTPSQSGQGFAEGTRYASGIRHALAIAWRQADDSLYVVQHGRDELSDLWPQKFTVEQGEVLPAEEMLRVTAGAEFGWPYCYYDPFQHRHVLAPEYGGDGMRVGRCAGYPEPAAAYPAHSGPNDLLFYGGTQFPARYRGGAFIAFHGAYRRGTATRGGYELVFQPFDNQRAASEWEVFASGFDGGGLAAAGGAVRRPTGLAEGPDGSLYVGDSETGRIWRILYRGPGTPPRVDRVPRSQ